MAGEGYLLKIILDGEVVAEAPLYVYDKEAAWRAFQEGFASLVPHIIGELYDTVRLSCDQSQLYRHEVQTGLTIDLQRPVLA